MESVGRASLSLALALIAFAANSADTAAARARCPAAGLTLLSSAQIRVFQVPRAGRVYACYRRSGKSWRLGNNWNDGSSSYRVAAVALAGPFVAWMDYASYGHSGTSLYVRSLDARSGVVERQWHPPGYDGLNCDHYFPPTQGYVPPNHPSIVVSARDGSIAWIVGHSRPCDASTRWEVWKSETHALKQEIDMGRDIDTTSLRLNGNVLSWMASRGAKSATLT